MRCARYRAGVALLGAALLAGALEAEPLPRCLFVSSYHRGYAWSDGVESGLRAALQGRCELRQFDMDSKRKKQPRQIAAAAREAVALIGSWRPDVLIIADDNAAKYLVQPYYRDAELPVVFAGINWSADEYGFPYRNTTGIIEIAPVALSLNHGLRLADGDARATYIGADTLTETKNAERFRVAASRLGIALQVRLVGTADGWLEAYADAQQGGFVVLGSNAGVKHWDAERIAAEVARLTRLPSVTNHGWMMPYALLGMTKIASEQGEWSGAAALAILDGTRPSDIPIVANRRWDYWYNEILAKATGLRLPAELRYKAKRYTDPS